MTLEYLPHLLSSDVHFTVVSLSLKVLESCLYPLKGWPAQADAVDLSSAISLQQLLKAKLELAVIRNSEMC